MDMNSIRSRSSGSPQPAAATEATAAITGNCQQQSAAVGSRHSAAAHQQQQQQRQQLKGDKEGQKATAATTIQMVQGVNNEA